MSDFFIHFSARTSLSKVLLAVLLSVSAPASYFCATTEAQAQTADVMSAGPGEKAGALGKGELLVYALKREKIDPTSIAQAMKSMGELFDFKYSRTGDRYLFKLSAGRKLTLLRYQRAQHIYETRLNEDGVYVSRLLGPGEVPAPSDAIIHPPQTELSDDEVDVERTAVMGSEAPVPMPLAAADDVRQDDDFAPADAPLQPIDEALMGRPNPDDLPSPKTASKTDHNNTLPQELDDEDLTDDDSAAIANAKRPADPSWEVVPPSDKTTHANKASDAKRDAPNDPTMVAEPRMVSLPSKEQNVRPEPPRPYAPFSLALACLGLIALIAGIIITVFPAWRARQHVKAAGLSIEDEIFISKGQYLALVSDTKHRYLLAISADATRLLTCCDDSAEAQRAWSFFKKKTYWHQLGAKALNDRQLMELVKAFNDSDVPEPQEQLEPEPQSTPANHPEPMPLISNTPTLPGGLLGKGQRDPLASDDHETLEVPELTDIWFSK